MEVKKCSCCKEEKTLDRFVKDKRRPGGLTAACKDCRYENHKKWAAKNQERIKYNNDKNKAMRKAYYGKEVIRAKYRELELKRKFNMTQSDYEKLLSKQDGVCAICKRYRVAKDKYYMVIDHYHTSGKVRGILCNKCNSGLGHFEDNIVSLENAIKYIKENNV